MDFLQGRANPEQLRLQQIEEEEKKRKEQEKKLEDLFYNSSAKQEEYLRSFDKKEKELRGLKDLKTREKENYSEFIKDHYGFTPDNKKKKVLAGVLEGVGGLASSVIPGLGLATEFGQGRYQSRKRAQDDYKSEYDKLLGVERLEAQQYRDQGKLQQDLLNSNQRQFLGQKKLDLQKEQTDIMEKLKTRQMDEQAKVAKGKQEVAEFNAYLNSLKTEAQNNNTNAKTEYQNIVNHISKEMGGIPPSMMNDNVISMYFSKKQNEAEFEDFTKKLGLVKKQGKNSGELKPQLKQTGKSYTIDENGNPQEKSIWGIVDPNNLGSQTPKSEAALSPEQIKQKQVEMGAKGIPPGTQKIGGSYLTGMDSKQSLQTIQSNPLGPQRDFGTGTTAKKNMEDYQKGKEMWRQLAQRSNQINQNLYDGIATGRSDWKDPIKQSNLGIAIRAATGNYGSDESTVKQSEVFNLMEHIRARFGTRPAFALFDKIAKTMDHNFANEESYAKQAGTMHLLVTLAQKMAEDERYVELLDKINKETEDNKENRIAFGVAFADEVNAAYKMAKAGYRNYIPNIDRVFQMATADIQRDKKAKRALR